MCIMYISTLTLSFISSLSHSTVTAQTECVSEVSTLHVVIAVLLLLCFSLLVSFDLVFSENEMNRGQGKMGVGIQRLKYFAVLFLCKKITRRLNACKLAAHRFR